MMDKMGVGERDRGDIYGLNIRRLNSMYEDRERT
jgi:hypothetical protein